LIAAECEIPVPFHEDMQEIVQGGARRPQQLTGVRIGEYGVIPAKRKRDGRAWIG
jgi:hypothetical protein